MKTAIEREGSCLYCGRKTTWYPCDGWVFHVTAKHWRCSTCHCATEPHLFVDAKTLAKIKRESAQRMLDQE